jgi:hypothetical protein
MKSLLSRSLLVGVTLGISFGASAGTRVTEVWQCTLNEGKTQEDVHDANGAWVKFVNDTVAGGDIHSYVSTSIVGNTNQFLYVDSFPNMRAWIDTKAANQTDEGQAIEAALNKAATCSSNSLHLSTETESK